MVKVQAEAWTDRRLEHDDTAGSKLGVSNILEVHFDYTITKVSFPDHTNA